MACSWRISHKLLLGLGLVGAVMMLFMAGTVKGLMSYRGNMRFVDLKLQELKKANDLREAVNALAKVPADGKTQATILAILNERLLAIREALLEYKEQLEDTITSRGDPRIGFDEKHKAQAIDERHDRLKKALAEASQADVIEPGATGNLTERPAVKHAIEELVSAAVDLNDVYYQSFQKLIKETRSAANTSMIIVVVAGSLGVLLIGGLLRWFYRWVFYPIRDLNRGVERVAHGDFEHRIEVRSGDEIEELAKAFNDMTARLHDMYTDLAQKVNERSRQLVRSERLAGVGFLAAGVAHEINNPLAGIAFCSEALESRLTDLLGERHPGDITAQDREIIAKYLKMIQEEAFRCKEIIHRLLDFSRGGEFKREPSDLGQIIQGVLDVVQHLPNSKGKQILYEQQDQLVPWVNAQEIKSVVLNIVVNALDSMEEGGSLTIVQKTHEGMAELVFQDTGCGMSAEILENIFEPFFSRSRTGKGTGLGLSISHRIITQHGGDIEAASAGPNQGSTFTVRLPLKPPEEQKESPEVQDPETEFSKLAQRKAA